MNKRTIAGSTCIILLSLILAISTTSPANCENTRGTQSGGFPRSFAELVEKIRPAVVNIRSTAMVTIPDNASRQLSENESDEAFDELLRKLLSEVPDKKIKLQTVGSGFIIDRHGFIITNNHIVENAEEIKVTLSDGREFKAKIVGRDAKTDLALIKISFPSGNLPVLTLGDSDKIRVGDWVLAVGNPFGLEHTVTQGIISATGRMIGSGPYDYFLQTDAPINAGSSGGPLVNLRGEIIGVNAGTISGGQGLGFAIPGNLAKSVAYQLKQKGKVVRGWLGISIQAAPRIADSYGIKESKGALVGDVVPGGPAESGGIKKGDVITTFDGKEIRNSSGLPRIIAETPAGKNVIVKVLRDGKELRIKVKIDEQREERFDLPVT